MDQQALDQLASLIQTDLEEDLIIYLTLSELNYVMSVIGPFDENTDKKIQFRIYKKEKV